MIENDLYAWLAAVRADDLTEQTRQRTLGLVLDHLCCALLGREQPWTRAVATSARRGCLTPNGERARIYGDTEPISLGGAALVNGTAGHAIDLDDTHLPTMTHLGAVVIPTVLALAESRDLPSSQILPAIVVGYEIAARAGRAIGLEPGERGIHGTSMYGVLGAAAAAAHLRNASADELRNAVGIAASFGSGIKAFQQGPGWTKRLHAGRAAEGGVLASQLAADGFKGPAEPLTGLFGFVRIFTPAVHEQTITGLCTPGGDAWEIDEVHVKSFPACAAVHGAIEAAHSALEERSINTDDLATVRVGVPQRVLDQNDIPEPQDALQAQYSTQYATALALLGHASDPAAYLDHLHENWSRARALAFHIELTLDVHAEAAYPASVEAALHLAWRNGTTLDQHGASRPADSSGWDVARRKFEAAVVPLVGSHRAGALVELALSLDRPDERVARRLIDQMVGIP